MCERRSNGKNTQIYCTATQRVDQSFEKVPVRLVGLHGPMRMSNAGRRSRRQTLTFTHHHEYVLFARECLSWMKQCRRCAVGQLAMRQAVTVVSAVWRRTALCRCTARQTMAEKRLRTPKTRPLGTFVNSVQALT